MSVLFEPTVIKTMALENRFVRSATNDGGADDNGHVKEKQMERNSQLAVGGVALIITGATWVHESGQILPRQTSIASDKCVSGLKKLTAAVHDKGGKIAVQLFHGGADAGQFVQCKNLTGLAPSFLRDDPFFPFLKGEYLSMSENQIWEVVRAFGQGARRAREAGFDAVQIHGAHGYLLSQFLSPYTNRREDEWGGSLENRLRFHREVYREIRRQVGEDYAVMIKMGVEDSFAGGLGFEEGKRAVRWIDEWGFDAVEVSSGLRGSGWEATEFRTGIKLVNQEGYYRHWCREVKQDVRIPVILVGGLRTFQLMEEIVQEGDADLIALSRPLINAPDIINDWKEGDRRRSRCLSCNKCIEVLIEGKMIKCVSKTRKKEFCRLANKSI